MVELAPQLKTYKNFQITSRNGYHKDNCVDFIIGFHNGSFDICELEFMFDLDNYKQLYQGESFPNTYDPDQIVLEQTGAIIKYNDTNKAYLEINEQPYYSIWMIIVIITNIKNKYLSKHRQF